MGRLRNPKGGHQGLRPHRHNHLEVCYVHRGRLRWWAQREWHDVRSGDLYVTQSGEPHGGTLGALDGCVLYWLQIDVQHPLLGLPSAESEALWETLRSLPQRHVHAGTDLSHAFDDALSALQDGELAATRVRHATLAVLLDVARSARTAERTGQDAIVRAAMALMRGHLHGRLDIPSMARTLGYSTSHFKQRFHREVGIGPAEYHLRMRIDEAARLLETTSLPIADVADRLGFPSGQYFATAFRRTIGIPPGRYRTNSPLTGPTDDAPLADDPESVDDRRLPLLRRGT